MATEWDKPDEEHRVLDPPVTHSRPNDQLVYICARDQARVDALTRDCPKTRCGAKVGEYCVCITGKNQGLRSIWPHSERTPYMDPNNKPEDAILHDVPRAVRWLREHRYLEKDLI